MRLLNLGCGSNHHADWVNIDMVSTGENVIAHNLLEGIPYNNAEFDVVYHSHILEHFTPESGKHLISECYRVLKPGGVLRVVVPDLEGIINEYQSNLQQALDGDEMAKINYEWTMFELYDQTVREKSQGLMGSYLKKETLPNESYIISRMGEESIGIRKEYFESLKKPQNNSFSVIQTIKNLIHPRVIRLNLLKFLLGKKGFEYWQIGKFRKGGEVHKWMYDRYSLKQLLENIGFEKIEVKNAFESNIPNWEAYQLDGKDQRVLKPDSLFIEALK